MSGILIVGDSPPSANQLGFKTAGWPIIEDLARRVGLSADDWTPDYVTYSALPEKWDEKFNRKRQPPGFVRGKRLNGWVPTGVNESVERFLERVEGRNPSVIVAAGRIPCALFTGQFSNNQWAGSASRNGDRWIVPTIAPAKLEDVYEWTLFVTMDLFRAKLALRGSLPEPPPLVKHIALDESNVDKMLDRLDSQLQQSGKLCCDLETFNRSITTCGLAAQTDEVFVFPFSRLYLSEASSDNLWSIDFELYLIDRILQLLKKAPELIGQNFLYDLQYLFRNFNFFPSRNQRIFDTMVAGHLLNPGARKSLDQLSRLYLPHYRFWKEDKKTEGGEENEAYYLGTESLWSYNADDVANTLHLRNYLAQEIKRAKLEHQLEFQFRTLRPLLRMMCRGTKIDLPARTVIQHKLQKIIREGTADIDRMTAGWISNPNSSPQLKKFFYGALKLPEQTAKGRKGASCDAASLDKLAKINPLIVPITRRLNHVRSSRLLMAPASMLLGPGDRAHCTYNPAGTETFRLSSSSSAFGEGTNFQNQTKGNDPKYAPKGYDPREPWMPNMREQFIPDRGYVLFEGDLNRADLNVVVWEAEDDDLKDKLRSGIDMHRVNAVDAFALSGLDKVTDTLRQAAKAGIHATNYGATPRTLARTLGITVREAERFQARWFAAHPGIRRWQDRVASAITSTRTIYNAFGYRFRWLGRIDKHAIDAALAWGPQSVVGLVTARIMVAIDDEFDFNLVEQHIQVHDSLVGQVREDQAEDLLKRIYDISQTIVVPYSDPLVIGFDLHLKKKSWAE